MLCDRDVSFVGWQVGEAQIHLEFTGTLNDQMKGFYRSQYTSSDGETRHAAVTQFESTDARRALPCWDEPAVKATFDVTLVVPKDRIALSNMVRNFKHDLLSQKVSIELKLHVWGMESVESGNSDLIQWCKPPYFITGCVLFYSRW